MTRPTRAEATAKAGEILAVARSSAQQKDPRALAEAAWHAGCGKTVARLEDQIRRRRGLPDLDRREVVPE
jgi:hypothetical protein